MKKKTKKINEDRIKEWTREKTNQRKVRIKNDRIFFCNYVSGTWTVDVWCGGIHNIKKSAQQSASTENDLCYILNRVIQSHRWYVSLQRLCNSAIVYSSALTHSLTDSLGRSLVGLLTEFIVRLSEQSCSAERLLHLSKSEFLDSQTEKKVRKKAQAQAHTQTHARHTHEFCTRYHLHIYICSMALVYDGLTTAATTK